MSTAAAWALQSSCGPPATTLCRWKWLGSSPCTFALWRQADHLRGADARARPASEPEPEPEPKLNPTRQNLNAEGRPTSKVPCGIRCTHPEGCNQRQRNILGIVANDGRGPRPALLAKGVKLEPTMLEVPSIIPPRSSSPRLPPDSPLSPSVVWSWSRKWPWSWSSSVVVHRRRRSKSWSW